MDILNKINKLLIGDETVTGDVASNDAQGSVDVVGGECPDGYYYCERRKKCVKKTDESSTVGGSYVDATSNITGSGQTRVVGDRGGDITVFTRKPRPLKFDKLFGAYLPPEPEEEEPEEEYEEEDE